MMFEQQSTPKNKQLKPSKSQPQDSIPSFIRKTYEILEENKFPDYIDWNPEGTAIVIKMPSEFAQKVLPTYFKHNNLTSFVRQLNMYNFHKKRTQNLDHVYFHELFRRGQKHLLKEIKRKNHDALVPANERSPLLYPGHPQKFMDTLPESQIPGDINSVSYENQFLKQLYNDAMTKAAMLESQVQELNMQNQNLWSQLCQLKTQLNSNNSGSSTYDMSYTNSIRSQRMQSDLTLDQLPMTMGDVCIPPLKLNNIVRGNSHYSNHQQGPYPNGTFLNKQSSNSTGYLNFFEDSTNSSDISYVSGSPSLQNHNESDKDLDNGDQYTNIPKLNQPEYSTEDSRNFKTVNPLKPMRQNISIGDMLESWNEKVEDDILSSFNEQQKENFDGNRPDGRVLMKRALGEGSTEEYNVVEPSAKRAALDQVNEDYDTSGNLDLMDFNGNSLMYNY